MLRGFAALPLPPANIAGLAAAVMLQHLRPWRLPGAPAGFRAAGSALVLSGCLVAGWATVARRDTDLQHPDQVTSTGPYRYSRHPMYVGWHLAHLGTALAMRSGWGLLTLAAAVAAIDREARREEQELAARFGRDYTDYATTVSRYWSVRRRTGSG